MNVWKMVCNYEATGFEYYSAEMNYVDGECEFTMFGRESCYFGSCTGSCEVTDDTITW